MTGLAGNPRAAGLVGVQVDGAAYPWVESYDRDIGTGPSALAANTAYFKRVPRRSKTISTTKIAVLIGTASGNIDVGIYGRGANAGDYTRLASTGSVAAAGSNAMQALDLAFTFQPNTDYWLAVAADNTTVTIGGASPSSANVGVAFLEGMFQKGTSFPLPSSVSSVTTTFGRNQYVIAYTPGV